MQSARVLSSGSSVLDGDEGGTIIAFCRLNFLSCRRNLPPVGGLVPTRDEPNEPGVVRNLQELDRL